MSKKNAHTHTKAQGTIEYLVIIGVVVVISLVSVATISGIMSNQQISENQNKTYFKTQTPFSINQVKANALSDETPAYCGEYSCDDQILFSVRNNSSEVLTLKKLYLDETEFEIRTCKNADEGVLELLKIVNNTWYQCGGFGMTLNNQNIFPHEEILLYTDNGAFRQKAAPWAYNEIELTEIKINYSTNEGIEKTQTFNVKYPIKWEETTSPFYCYNETTICD